MDRDPALKRGWQHADRLRRYCLLAEAAGCMKPAERDGCQCQGDYNAVNNASGLIISASQQSENVETAATQLSLPVCTSATCIVHNAGASHTAAPHSKGIMGWPSLAQIMQLCKAQSTTDQWVAAKSLLTKGVIHLMTARHEQHPDTAETLLRVTAHILVPLEDRPTVEPCSCTGLADVGSVAANVPEAMAAWSCRSQAKTPTPCYRTPENPLYQQEVAGPFAPELDTNLQVNKSIYEQDAHDKEALKKKAKDAFRNQEIRHCALGIPPAKKCKKKQVRRPEADALSGDFVVEVVINPTTFAVLASAASCCGVGYDPLRNTPCATVTATLLQLAAAPELVLCEHDLANLVNQLEPHNTGSLLLAELQDVKNTAASSIMQNKHRLVQVLVAASGGCYEANNHAMDIDGIQNHSRSSALLHPTLPAVREHLLCSSPEDPASRVLSDPNVFRHSRAVLKTEVDPKLADCPLTHLRSRFAGAGFTESASSPAVLAIGPWTVSDTHPSWLREDYACNLATERPRTSGILLDGCSLGPKYLHEYLKRVLPSRVNLQGWSATMHLLAGSDVTTPLHLDTLSGTDIAKSNQKQDVLAISDIQSLQLHGMASVRQAFYMRQIQLQAAQPAVFQNLRTNHTIDPFSLIQVVQPMPGMTLQDFAKVCQSLLSAIQSDLGPESHQAGTLSPGMIAVLGAAAPAPEIPAEGSMNAQQVIDLWATRIAGRRHMMEDKALPPALVRAALLVRLKTGFEQLNSIINSHPATTEFPDAPVSLHSDPGIAAAHISACECVAEDLYAFFKTDAHSCATLLAVPAMSLMRTGNHEPRWHEPDVVPVNELVSVCSAKGGPGLRFDPALTCVGPLFPVSVTAQLRRLPPFMRKLGEHLRGAPQFIKVIRVFSSTTTLPEKLLRFISKNPTCDVEALAKQIAKDHTNAEIDKMKSDHIPWPPTVTTGSKVVRANELAAYILEHKKDIMVTYVG